MFHSLFSFQIILYKQTNFHLDVCDKPIKIKSKCERLKSLSDIELDKCTPKLHTIKNTDFIGMDELFHEYISNHKKFFVLYLVLIINLNPHLINAPERSKNHPLFRYYNHIPLIQYSMNVWVRENWWLR